MPDGTAAPMQYQSLPNRPFVSPRDLPGYGRTPSPTLPSEPTISETDVTPSIETSAPTPTSSMPSTRASLTPSEQIDRALDDLEEIRAQIKTFSCEFVRCLVPLCIRVVNVGLDWRFWLCIIRFIRTIISWLSFRITIMVVMWRSGLSASST